MTVSTGLSGKVAVISGAASGIGQAIARDFAEHGAIVVGLDIVAAATATATATDKHTATPEKGSLFIQVDITQPDEVAGALAQAITQFGRIDIAVNCAGVLSDTPLDELKIAEWNKVLAVNLTGTFSFCQAVLPHMQAQGNGTIVLFSSIAARTGGVLSGPAYAASKGGVSAFAKWLARSVASSGINVNVVAPGPIQTPMTQGRGYIPDAVPAGRLGETADIVGAVRYLVGPESSFIYGHTLDVNGGIYMN
jgi:3-oxoacyl-[acyl-carrier protein] reductase